MNLIRAFFPKIKALFFKFWKRAGETSPPSPFSYAPDVGEENTEGAAQKCFIKIDVLKRVWKIDR